MPEKLKVGDVCVLNSGGPKMTVVRVSENSVDVKWIHEKNLIMSTTFPDVCVTAVPGEKSAL